MQYTYFVMTPGFEEGSFIQYPNTAKGNYFKFGDTGQNTALGVRMGYTTHNPDFGVFAVIENGLSNGNLGTRIKNDIINLAHINTVIGTEWFSIQTAAAWLVAKEVQKYNGKKINDLTYPAFQKAIIQLLK